MTESTNTRLRITEIFYSLQGETTFSGLPTVFVRLTGCPLRCTYCDSEYAFKGGKYYTIEEVLKEVSKYNPKYVCVTGGEPLAQKAPCLELLNKLSELYTVSLETSGAIDISAVDKRVHKIIDIKTPGSNEVDKNLLSNLASIDHNSQFKFVITSQEDFAWAKNFIKDYNLPLEQVLFSPSYQQISNKDLASWILKDNLMVRMQLQIHKYIWGDMPGV